MFDPDTFSPDFALANGSEEPPPDPVVVYGRRPVKRQGGRIRLRLERRWDGQR